MNEIELTMRFCQTLALFITCHLTPAILCLHKAIKQVSDAYGAPCDTKQMPLCYFLPVVPERNRMR